MKLKIYFSSILISLLVSTACDSRSRIVFESTSHDFGKVKTESVLSHTFRFTNAGNATLVIERIKAG